MATHEITPTCGAVIFDTNGKVLLVEHLAKALHLTGSFGLPAGRIEEWETALEAIVREVQEETGLSLYPEVFKKLPTVYAAEIERKDGTKHMSFEVFVTTVDSRKLAESKETKPQWVPLQKVPTLNLLPNVWEAIQEAQTLTV